MKKKFLILKTLQNNQIRSIGKMEQPVDAEGITERARENTENIFA